MRTVTRFCTAAALAWALGGGALAQQTAPLSVEEILDAPAIAPFSPAVFSPDGRLLAYLVTDSPRRRIAVERRSLLRYGLAWYGIASDIWITDLKSGDRRRITGGTGNHWALSWSPDGQRLAFLADRSNAKPVGPARLWVWERESNALRQVSNADVREGFDGIDWADSHSVLVSLFPADIGREGFAALMEGKPPATSQPDVTAKVFEYDPAAKAAPHTEQVSLDVWLRDLGVVDIRTGAVRRLASGRIGQAELSPDRKRIAYSVVTHAEKPGSGQYLYDIFVRDLAAAGPVRVASDVRLPLAPTSLSFSRSGDLLAWRTGGPVADDEIYVVPVNGGEAVRISKNPATPRLAWDVPPPAWDAAGANVYFTREGVLWRASVKGTTSSEVAKPSGRELEILAPRQRQLFSPDGKSAIVLGSDTATKRAGLMRIDLQSGAATPLFEEDKRYGGYGTEATIAPDGASVAYVAEDPAHPPDFYVAGAAAKPRRVSDIAPALGGRQYGRAEVLDWKTVDGDTLHGALIYPSGYQSGRTYPLIVKVYGGSSISNDLNRFGYAIAPIENLQVYASRGYALLLADSKLNLGTPMVDIMKSVMPGINKAIDTGVADPNRIGVMGHSYGGYSTLSLIVQSPRFKAAVMRAGMGDLIGGYGQLAPDGTNYGLEWAESGQGRMGGSPWDFRERYVDNSPIFFLDRVKTPLLIIHGEKDDAVPVYLADEVFTGLRRLGKTVTYVRYADESHWEGAWSRANQIDSLSRIVAWFDKHLKGDQ